jgi:hypothetical protein
VVTFKDRSRQLCARLPNERRLSEAASIAYFAVLPLSRTEDGEFLAEAAIEVRGVGQAAAIAASIAGGARCFRQDGRSQLGEWQDAAVRGCYATCGRSGALHVEVMAKSATNDAAGISASGRASAQRPLFGERKRRPDHLLGWPRACLP